MVIERCARCGTARRGDLQVCVRCETPFAAAADPDVDVQRPAAPSRVQTHGTMAAVVVIGVVLMGLFFGYSIRKVGPFKGELLSQRPSGTASVTVSVKVTNGGARAGRGNCRVKVRGAGQRTTNVAPFLTDRIPAKGSITRDVEVPTDQGTPVEISCA